MEKRIKINSIDLDYFGTRGFPSTISDKLPKNIDNLFNYLIKCHEADKPVYIANGHGDILDVINEYIMQEVKYDEKIIYDIINFDFHDDMQLDDTHDLVEDYDTSYDACWADTLMKKYPNSSYKWIYPSKKLCLDDGEGICNRFKTEDVMSVEESKKNFLITLDTRYDNVLYSSSEGKNEHFESLIPADITFIAISEEYVLSRVLETISQKSFINNDKEYSKIPSINQLRRFCITALSFRNSISDTSSVFFAIDGFSKAGSKLPNEYEEYKKHCKENNYVIQAFDYLKPQMGFFNVGFVDNLKEGWFTPQSMIYNYILSEFCSDDFFLMRSLMFRLIDPMKLTILASMNAQNINFYETEFNTHDWDYIFRKLE